MPSCYHPKYLSGINRWQLREELFQQYENDNGIKVDGEINRALIGKELFFHISHKMNIGI
jgi:hypothetical protein